MTSIPAPGVQGAVGAGTVVPRTPDYYSPSFWNDYAVVRAEINRRISGSPDTTWHRHFHERVSRRRFRKALFLMCGNGWVERSILEDRPLFEEAVGVDVSTTLLDQARDAARGLPIRYYEMDVNRDALPEDGFDLVVNVAACHHIAYLDRVLRLLCSALSPDGYLVSFDYVGPHRNQYTYLQWNAAWELNQLIPAHLRRDMDGAYPHLSTMLHVDPTEAVHSELILPVTARYFHFEEHRHAGGALAYEVLLNNEKMRNAPEKEQERWVTFVMDADLEFLQANPGASYFDYYACRPNQEALRDATALARWTEEETRREEEAQKRGGRYHEHSLLQTLYSNLADSTVAADHRLRTIHQLQAQLRQIEQSRSWRLARRIANAARWVRTAARAGQGSAGTIGNA